MKMKQTIAAIGFKGLAPCWFEVDATAYAHSGGSLFAPHIGVNWEKAFGGTVDHTREEGGSSSDLPFVLGVRAWF